MTPNVPKVPNYWNAGILIIIYLKFFDKATKFFRSAVYLTKMYNLWPNFWNYTEIPNGIARFHVPNNIYTESLHCILYALLLCVYYKKKAYIRSTLLNSYISFAYSNLHIPSSSLTLYFCFNHINLNVTISLEWSIFLHFLYYYCSFIANWRSIYVEQFLIKNILKRIDIITPGGSTRCKAFVQACNVI